jgi:1-acyl-sn-glycerol-3-phosphate acyltransferase
MKQVNLTSSQPTILQTILAFLAWNGLYVFFLGYNLCLIFGSSFIVITPMIGTRTIAALIYAGFILVLPSGGFKCHLKDGLPWRGFVENWTIGKIMKSYLNLKFGELPKAFVEEEKKPGAQFIIAGFPHGCGSEFRVLMEGIVQNVMPNIVQSNNYRTLAASVLFHIPLIRELVLWTGCVDANRKTAGKCLDRGRSLLILPGGEAEQILTTYGKEQVYLKSRKGFIKLGMRKGVPVVPMYVFGNSDLFHTSSFLLRPRKWLMKSFGVCIPICFGLFGTLCPLPKTITIVFGSPLKFDMKGADPTDEELDVAHKTFCKELELLFDLHKDRLGYGDRKLEIV